MADDPALVPLSVEEITAIEERCAKATRGPWEDVGGFIESPDDEVTRRDVKCMAYCYGGSPYRLSAENGAFISAARVDLPRALVTCRAFLELVERIEQLERVVTDPRNGQIFVGRQWLQEQLRALLTPPKEK